MEYGVFIGIPAEWDRGGGPCDSPAKAQRTNALAASACMLGGVSLATAIHGLILTGNKFVMMVLLST